ncbi:MFS transporter [Roseovarius spongiae]|uniref:MFS transporter n=1 Tax=Roseovarius spongiae TaxID=2320272 RepID=A0A3A8B7J9_9RHOB|nr:MFS transporter [Roseovarius spongiae]RKF12849.1 MFS transporter [Roseovarius spongiae]
MAIRKLYGILADSPEEAEAGEPRRFMRHLASLSATKLADGLIDPKLVLAWLMSALGAPAYLIGALVPVRESGALLPQILLAREIQKSRVRKWFWAAGSFIQGIAALGIGASALLLDGAAAGWAILGCLAVLALARAACSASYKDIAARTLRKGSRGTVSGAAGTAAAVLVLAFAVALALGAIPREPGAIGTVVLIAGGLWIAAALVFAGLDEPAGNGDGAAMDSAAALLRPLREDDEFRRYVAVRALLIPTALAPPFIVMLSNQGQGESLGNLGSLMIASSLATILSSYVWGRLSDHSSRLTLALSAGAAAVALAVAAGFGVATGGTGGPVLAGLFVFVAQIAYEGVRAGRKIHLTDMDTNGAKPVYTALSNTLIGVLLFLGGGFGLLADAAGPAVVLAVFAGFCAVAAALALGLSEVQQESGA